MTLGRRDVIKFATGSACGVVLTPVPWKLLDDSANWSQNWSWIPKVPRGEMSVMYSTCTLCPAGCGVKAHCVAGRAVGIEGAAAHPLSHGALCTSGIAGHTAACHPRRLLRPSKGKTTVTAEAAVSEIAARIATGVKVAILDLGPERALSALYRGVADAFGNAMYLRVPERDEATLRTVASLLGRAPGTLGFDIEHTRTLISFGAPVLENWAVPGRVLERWRTGELRVIHVGPRQSRTALAAATWIPVEPGGEAAFAIRLAQGQASNLQIEGPAVAVGSGGPEESAVAALNVALGAVGRVGGIVARSPLPWKQEAALDIDGLPDHSIGVLFVDSSRASEVTPWPAIRRKLSEGALVVALAYREDAVTERAGIVLPVAAPFESIEDAGTAPCAASPSFAIASALIDAPAVKETPIDHLNAVLRAACIAAPATTVEQERTRRATAIHAGKKGSVVSYADGTVTKVADLASPEDLMKKLAAGACWVGEPSGEKLRAPQAMIPPVPPPSPRDEHRPFTLLVYESPDDTSPLTTKLYQESGLYTPSSLVRMSPGTAARVDVKSGARVSIDTVYGSTLREVLVDPAVMPGVIEVAGGSGGADITDISTGGESDWRTAAANVRRA